MNHPLQCRCGAIRGQISQARASVRGVCYCKDCQAYARWLGSPADVLDAAGGTDLMALQPAQVSFTQGREQVRCVTLTEKGPLRWYAGCCRTPIGNTARSAGLPYVGLVHSALRSAVPTIEQSFGPVQIRLNTGSALAPVDKTGAVRTALTMVRLMRRVLTARLNGRYRDNPFFDGQGQPISPPQRVVGGRQP